jgi:uncharacterized protein with NRDE domain
LILKCNSKRQQFNGFNLFYGNLFEEKVELNFITNRSSDFPPKIQAPKPITLQSGIHTVSNSSLNDLSWPKVKSLTTAVRTKLESLKGKELKPKEMCLELAECINQTQSFQTIPKQYEIFNHIAEHAGLKHVWVPGKLYKTRSQTIILKHKDGTVYYYYRNTDNLDDGSKGMELWKEYVINKKN